ncbi:MAG: hypothetical protein JW915_03705 [Chitinispirillaceae bacterium]|nr:hypothetical protein [Chitinispirillaceae bacterium]
MIKKFTLAASVMLMACCAFADESDEIGKISFSGDGNIMFGQVVKGYAYGRSGANSITNHWMNFYSGRLNATSRPTEWFTTKLSLEVSSSFPIIRESTIMKETYKLQYRPSMPQAVGTFNFKFDNVFSSLLAEAGLIEYAFNPEVKNLGNYMYRSAAYPFNLQTKPDYIYSNLMAIRMEAGFLDDQLMVGSILNSATQRSPFFDMNLSIYAGYSHPDKLVEAKAGLCFDRFIPINDSLTKSIAMRSILGDSTLTLQGQKLHAYVSFDPKKLFGDIDLFGKEDLKIYAEGAIVGFKDPDYYANDTVIVPSLANRIPLMLGINIPTFKILDLFNFEVEYCKYPYANDWWGYSQAQPPTPKPFYPSEEKWRKIYRDDDNWKWSLYIKKSISKFDIIALFANDHVIYETYSAESHQYTEQSLRKSTNWHWFIKLQYHL